MNGDIQTQSTDPAKLNSEPEELNEAELEIGKNSVSLELRPKNTILIPQHVTNVLPLCEEPVFP